MKIGLLGGSFNPAHEGHLHISEIARKKLGLTQVWWIVSPQNPLKSAQEMMPFKQRFLSAEETRNHNPKIRVSDIEHKFGTRFTVDTLKRLKQKHPQHKFYFLMGADNLIQLTRWKNWRSIFKYAQIHVFDRDELVYPAIKSRVAIIKPIYYHRIPLCNQSSTKIRKLLKD